MIIDRIEGQWVIIEWQGQIVKLPAQWLPRDVKEGDVLVASFEVDQSATESRKEEMKKMLDDFFA